MFGSSPVSPKSIKPPILCGFRISAQPADMGASCTFSRHHNIQGNCRSSQKAFPHNYSDDLTLIKAHKTTRNSEKKKKFLIIILKKRDSLSKNG